MKYAISYSILHVLCILHFGNCINFTVPLEKCLQGKQAFELNVPRSLQKNK